MNSLLNDKDFDDRFRLSGRMEILSVLNDLIRSRAAVSVYLDRGREFFLTNLLEARAPYLVFDIGANDDINRKMESAEDCLCVASHQGIRVRFRVTAPQRTVWGDMDAYRSPLPTQLLRLQRRETHRVLMPVTKPVSIDVTRSSATEPHSAPKAHAYPLHDLSVEGAGFNIGNESQLFRTGEAVTLHFALSKAVAIHCLGTVRHVTQAGERNGKPNFRVGVSFDNLASRSQVAIQRFLVEVEVKQRALLKE